MDWIYCLDEKVIRMNLLLKMLNKRLIKSLEVIEL